VVVPHDCLRGARTPCPAPLLDQRPGGYSAPCPAAGHPNQLRYAGQIVTIEVDETILRVYDQREYLIKIVPRTSRKGPPDTRPTVTPPTVGGGVLGVVVGLLAKVGKTLVKVAEALAAAAVVFLAVWLMIKAALWALRQVVIHWREGIRQPLRIRAGWVPDETIKQLETFVTGPVTHDTAVLPFPTKPTDPTGSTRGEVLQEHHHHHHHHHRGWDRIAESAHQGGMDAPTLGHRCSGGGR